MLGEGRQLPDTGASPCEAAERPSGAPHAGFSRPGRAAGRCAAVDAPHPEVQQWGRASERVWRVPGRPPPRVRGPDTSPSASPSTALGERLAAPLAEGTGRVAASGENSLDFVKAKKSDE